MADRHPVMLARLAAAWVARRWPQLRLYNGDEPVKSAAPAG